MQPLEVALVFVVAPLAVVGVLAALTLRGGDRRTKEKRYRPGRPFEFAPVWFLSSPGQLAGRLAITSSNPAGDDAAAANPHGPTGGASDRW
ncbi:aa3-type cytochrome oxidase subunit CtaJ [Catenuloplanes indicus]|uniref:Uncharacterized protein n=1 Tax=Catenuloplanes indicus TaxID=137267 RepID=A0AAE3VZD3_9ACTN|nr:hypothetical protein [Catenuloplanes indicus]MDQ0366402.1 hypothetical protein [Catenuloplanes indicus]